MITINGKSIQLIDAHTHIWDEYKGMRFGNTPVKSLGYGKISFDGKIEKLLPPSFVDNRVSAEILLGYMDDNCVDKAVILQNPCYGDQKEYVSACLKKYPDRFLATMGKVDPREINRVVSVIDMLVHEYSCSGIKIEIPDVPFIIDAPEYDFMWKKIMNENLMVVLDLGFGDGEYDWNIDRLTNLLHRYPDIRMRLPHLGICRLWDLNQKYPYQELQKVLALFKINKNNLYLDFSAMQFFDLNDEYPDERNQDIIKTVYETIGSEKLLWGSDFPTVLKLRTIKQCIEFITKQCSFLSIDDMENILSRNVIRELKKK
ncbi:MAG: amidohydrolase family protein [Eubacteriales bacterium]|nr:amidohydrolase family protein [Eubacteriales bacterium]